MKAKKLTPKSLQAIRPAPKGTRVDHWDTVLTGFGVRVNDKGRKSFIVGLRWPGKTTMTRRTIGSADNLKVLSLSEAREIATKWLKLAKFEKVDPKVREREEEEARVRRLRHTVAAVAEDWFEEKVSTERRGAEARREFNREFLSIWGPRPITDITRDDVLRVVNAKKKTAPSQARNLFLLAKRFFQWAEEQHRYGLTASPCDKLKHSKIIGARTVGERVLSDIELFALQRVIRPSSFYSRARLSRVHGVIYHLLLLTGLRLNEVARAEWSEFDPAVVRALRRREDGEAVDWRKFTQEQRTWEIPAARMKGKNGKARAHLVPLTRDMLRLLEGLGRPKGQFVFSTTGGDSSIWMSSQVKDKLDAFMLRTLRALARREGDDPSSVKLSPWKNHDIRRTVRTELSRLRVNGDVGEAILAHAMPGIRGVYDKHQYLDEKREALELWGAHLRSLLQRSPPDNVVPMRARKLVNSPQEFDWPDDSWPIGMSASGELNVVEDDGDAAEPSVENE